MGFLRCGRKKGKVSAGPLAFLLPSFLFFAELTAALQEMLGGSGGACSSVLPSSFVGIFNKLKAQWSDGMIAWGPLPQIPESVKQRQREIAERLLVKD